MPASCRHLAKLLTLVIMLSGVATNAQAQTSAEPGMLVPAFQMPLADPLPVRHGPQTDCQQSSLGVGDQPLAAVQSGTSAQASQKATWSLPMEGLLGTAGGASSPAIKSQPRRFDASINLSDGRDAVTAKIDDLLEAALAKDPESARLNNAVKHFSTKTQKVVAESKDTLDYVISYRGFGPSSEAGDIILGEKVKLKSRASAEYARQKHIDEMHYKVVSNVMQIAMGLGMADKTRGAGAVDSGLASLKELVGDEEAEQTYSALKSWMQEIDVPESVYGQGAWEVTAKESKFKTVMKNALDTDPVLQEITKRLHKYNHRSKFARASAHVVETTLGAAALTPTFVGPAAKAALVTFVMSTGGPEQCKLLKELYLDKRFESRITALNEQAHLALDNYQVALLTRNPVLLACAESVVQEIAGEDTATDVFGRSVLPKRDIATGPITQQ